MFVLKFFHFLHNFHKPEHILSVGSHNKGVEESKKQKLKKRALAISGLFVGAVNGLLGGGGGMIVVPVLQTLGGLDTKKAHATAISVMLPLCIVSAVIYTIKGIHSWQLGTISAVGVTVGGLVGALLLSKLPKTVISMIFDLLMIAAGVRMIVG